MYISVASIGLCPHNLKEVKHKAVGVPSLRSVP